MMCMFINTIVDAKYIIEEEICVAQLNIDRCKPSIEILSISNSNIGFERYANNTHEIGIRIKIIEKNLKSINLNKEYIKIKVENQYIETDEIQCFEMDNMNKIYEIKIKKINGNGDLKIEFLEGAVIDNSELKNELIEIDTQIIIDNILPCSNSYEDKIADGKVNYIINFNEKIRDIEGWKFSEDKFRTEKEFTNNISYELPIMDYAGNSSTVKVDITKATYINIVYASHNSDVGWTFGYGNYDIAGKKAIEKNPIFKTEALAFKFNGNIDSDFLQVNSYIHTHWGIGSYGRCSTSGMIYNYGYNPNYEEYKSMNSNDLVTIQGEKYFQLGGAGVNGIENVDAYGNNPIPKNTANEYHYGICGIKMKLKDYSYYSVIYQILVNDVGWLNTCSDGEESMYNSQKPMSAFRMALVPKTEKQYLIDMWNKDVGTYNLK